MELDQLIQTEQRLDRALQQAREECGRMVDAARAAALGRESALATELADRARARVVAAEAERRRCEAEIASGAARRVAGYDGVTDEQVRTLARSVVVLLVGSGPA